MFDIEATVTVATPTELTLTANWPIRWLEAAGGFEIQRKVVQKEILPEFDGTVKRLGEWRACRSRQIRRANAGRITAFSSYRLESELPNVWCHKCDEQPGDDSHSAAKLLADLRNVLRVWWRIVNASARLTFVTAGYVVNSLVWIQPVKPGKRYSCRIRQT
jgi:hypothetical protein